MAEPLRGRVQRILVERGYGFIRCVSGDPEAVGVDFFFHASALLDCQITELEEGSTVRFEARKVAKGMRAERIERELQP